MAEQMSVEDQIRGLGIEEAPAGLYERIMTVVPHLPQQQPAPRAPKGFRPLIERFIGEWQYGLSLKIAALGVVALMGVMMGHADNLGGGSFGNLIFGDIGVEDVI